MATLLDRHRTTLCRSSRSRCSWRRLRDTASVRPLHAAAQLNEAPLRALAVEALRTQETRMRELLQTQPHHQALQTCCTEFNDRMQRACMQQLERVDTRLLELARAAGPAGLRALWVVGALEPGWAASCAPSNDLDKVADALRWSRPAREFNLRSRVVRTATSVSYAKSTVDPTAYTLPGLDHVLSSSDVARLRAGEALVIDPWPRLLAPAQMAMAHEDLMRLAAAGGVMLSKNPCNEGASHGMLPLVEPGGGDGLPLRPPTRELLRKLAALPALVAAHGWPRRLTVPSMAQLGFFPADGRSGYVPHLDRRPEEQHNRREITFLVYVNAGWDAARDGGCLRLYDGDAEGAQGHAPSSYTDVEPVAGRLVVFESGRQLHEVRPCSRQDRLALTLWVEHVA